MQLVLPKRGKSDLLSLLTAGAVGAKLEVERGDVAAATLKREGLGDGLQCSPAIAKYLVLSHPGALTVSGDQQILVDEWVARGARGLFDGLDAALTQDYLVGGKLTLADLAVFAAAREAGGVKLGPKGQKWMARIEALPFVGAALAAAEKDAGGKKKDKKEKKGGADTLPIGLEPPSGTRDFFPDEKRFHNWLFEKYRAAAKSFGFQEYDAPVLEHQVLYKRKAGEEIVGQMYAFTDQEGAEVTLRPEMTPSLARMVLSLCRLGESKAEKVEIAALMPLKWFSIPQCWRFETTQRGRKREHYQWNCDIVGMPNVNAEMEVLACMVTFFESVGITAQDVGIKINSRKVLGCVLESAGVSKDQFEKVCVLVDKLDKIGADEVVKQLVEELGLPRATAESIVESTTTTDWESLAKYSAEGVEDLRTLFKLAEGYGCRDWLIFDASVVRGLAYYTGIVFEAFDRRGELRAIAGGGRYDRLLTLYGAPQPIPCVGFGFGDCVIKELLMERNLMPPGEHVVDYVVSPYSDEMMPHALRVARALREAGKSVDVAPEAFKKVQKAFKYADKAGARRIAFVAPAEWETGKVRIKDLRTGDAENRPQVDVPLEDLGKADSYFE